VFVCLWSQVLKLTPPLSLFQLDVKEAKVITDHPQWDISDEEGEKEEGEGEDTEEDSDYSSEDDDDDWT